MKNLLIVMVLLMHWAGCEKDKSFEPDRIEPGENVSVDVVTYIQDPDFQASIRSLIQANDSGLFMTPVMPVKNTVLFHYDVKNDGPERMSGPSVFRGQGPNEALDISLSAKNTAGDTLAFLSINSAKILFIDAGLNVSERFLASQILTKTGDAFSYSNGYLGFSMEPRLGEGNLFGVYNFQNGSFYAGFPLRVPLNMEPAIRNRVFASAAVPDGFVFAFTGDRKFYRVNYKAEITGIYVLGEDEPIGEPFRINNPKESVSSRPYITKMEYSNGYLHVMMDQKIWVIDLESRQSIAQLEFVDKSGEIINPFEFTMNGKMLFIRQGRDLIHKVEIDQNWYGG